MLLNSVVALKPSLTSRDFERSKQFYLDLGFTLKWESSTSAEFQVGAFSFLLKRRSQYGPPPDATAQAQIRYGQVVYLEVEDSEAWWNHVCFLELELKYPESNPAPPFYWGERRMMTIQDPSGNTWRILKAMKRDA